MKSGIATDVSVAPAVTFFYPTDRGTRFSETLVTIRITGLSDFVHRPVF
jgi:hypothetical protein